METFETVAYLLKSDFLTKEELMKSSVNEITKYLEILAGEMKKKVSDLVVVNKFFEIVEKTF